MPLSKDDITKLKNLMNYGVLLDTVTLMIDYSIQHDKADFLNKLKDLMTTFQNSLADNEKGEFAKDTDVMMREKADKLLKELELTCTPKEVDELLLQLKNS